MEIVKQKKVSELWEAGDNLDQACENCHLGYWYPGDKPLARNSIALSRSGSTRRRERAAGRGR